MGLVAFTWVLSNWKTERLSQALCLKFFVQPIFWSFASSFAEDTAANQEEEQLTKDLTEELRCEAVNNLRIYQAETT